MADIIEEVVEQQQPQVNEELANQMAISLNNGLPLEKTEIVNESANTIIEQEKDVIVDANEYLKTNLGYENWEDAKTEIEQLRQLKANPTPAEIKFENDISKELFNAIQAGKSDEVFKILEQQKKLELLTTSEITNDNAVDIVKYGMRLKNSDLTELEVNRIFNRKFQMPEKPSIEDVKSDTNIPSDDEEKVYQDRLSKWQSQVDEVNLDISIEAKMLKPELELAKSKLVLPKVESAVDENYTQYLERLSNNEKAAIENTAEYKKYTPKVLETKINFNDEANKIAFEFQYEPDSESFSKVIDTICDNQLFESAFLDQEGNLDRKKFADVIYYGLNKDKIIMEALKQAKNATIKSMLPDNSSGGANRQLPQGQEMSDLDKMMQASLAGYTR